MDAFGPSSTSDELPRQGSFRFSWPSFLFIALVIYELTSYAWLGVTLLCTKFGWEYFRTAIWLKRRDPDGARGRICFWIFTAAGLWRAAVAGVALMFAYAALHIDKKKQAPPPEFIEAVLVAIVGFLMSACATLFAMVVARWHRRKIWLDAKMHQRRALDVWPPVTSGPNQAGTLILTSVFVIALPFGCLAFGILILVAGQLGLVNRTLGIAIATGALFLLPISILAGRDYLQRRILSCDAREYWAEFQSDSDSVDRARDRLE